METIQLPLSEYQQMREELLLLRNSELMTSLNRLVELLFQEKYGLFLQDYTGDLTAHAVNAAWQKEDTNAWDNV